MVQAAKTLLDPSMTEAAKTELDKASSESDENLGSMSSSIQPSLAQATQASNSSTLGPMQAYGPINIPPGTMIRRVQNLPAGAVPIDPSMLPPGMIPVHAKANPNASQGMPRSEIAEHGKPRRISDDSGQTAPPKIPARSKTPLRNVSKQAAENNLEETLTTPARKQKHAGGGGRVESPSERKAESAAAAAPGAGGKNINPLSSKEARKADVAETAESALPQVKAVPPSPKVYIRKVKGKAKKS